MTRITSIVLVSLSLSLLGGCGAYHNQPSSSTSSQSSQTQFDERIKAEAHCYDECIKQYNVALDMCERNTASILNPADAREALANCLKAKQFPFGEDTCKQCYNDTQFYKNI